MSLQDAAAPAFSARALRDVLGSFPTGVAVVTAVGADGELFGVTVSSFNSVSLDPPLVLFSLARSLYSLERFLSADVFAVNLLREDQADLSTRFATALADKWSGVPYRDGPSGSPILEPALAVLECRHYAQHDGGDHVIVVGRVTHLEADHRHMPLAFFRGRYRTLAALETQS
jgi:flavin reductase (DIM6/NTAB) family NADH-FMN oxidoreductase RutF